LQSPTFPPADEVIERSSTASGLTHCDVARRDQS